MEQACGCAHAIYAVGRCVLVRAVRCHWSLRGEWAARHLITCRVVCMLYILSVYFKNAFKMRVIRALFESAIPF